MKPRVGIVLGDPCGIGPELVAKLLADSESRSRANIIVLGDKRIFDAGAQVTGTALDARVVESAEAASDTGPVPLIDRPPLDPAILTIGEASVVSGRWQLDCLQLAVELCTAGQLDGFCFAPLNKDAMHQAGLTYEDEQGFIAEVADYHGPLGMMNTLGNIWTSRVTSHVGLGKVSELITVDSVLEAIRIGDATMRAAGYERPKMAVAGFNPHAGDGGIFGDEEIVSITPAIEKARAEGIIVEGPFPPDTIFLKGRDGIYDAIVTMYHDQGQIAMKLMGFDHGVTVHAGLPFALTTSAHGSAYDIAGQGIAKVDALKAAFALACDMAETVQRKRAA